MSQTTFLSDVLGDGPIPPGKLAYFRARLTNLLHEAVLELFIKAESEKGLTRAELARRIGRKPEQVTRWLGSPGNWTLETLSDLLTAMGHELDPVMLELSRHQDPQALANLPSAHAPLQALNPQSIPYGLINSSDAPVTVTFAPGQIVLLYSIQTDQSDQPHPPQDHAPIHIGIEGQKGYLPSSLNHPGNIHSTVGTNLHSFSLVPSQTWQVSRRNQILGSGQ